MHARLFAGLLGLVLMLIDASQTTIIKRQVQRNDDHPIAVQNGGCCGTWRNTEFCPTGSYAVGYSMKIETPQGSGLADDDTALNGIRLMCQTPMGHLVGTITSDVAPWGDWGRQERCPTGTFLTSFSLQVSPWSRNSDDTSASFVKFKCRDFARSLPSYTLAVSPGQGYWGRYGAWSDVCPQHMAICGMKTKVEGPQGRNLWQDDTALNDVIFYCCD